LKIDNERFTMRYQNFVLRFMEPVDLFKNLVVAFISADSSPLMAGVNIVSPEDGATSMKDYWLHMVMFNYCHTKFPDVKLHACRRTYTRTCSTGGFNIALTTLFIRLEPTALGTELIWLMKANHTSCCATWQKQDSHRNQLGQ
jgi:hypothetical protein